SLLPQLHTGQKLSYQIRLRVNKQTRSESRVATPTASADAPIDILRTIEIDVLDVAPESPRSKLILGLRILDPAAASPARSLNLPSGPDGVPVPSKGGEEPLAEDTEAWKAWLDLFVTAWTLPAKPPRLGEKWTAEEPISAAPLAALSWQKESQ